MGHCIRERESRYRGELDELVQTWGVRAEFTAVRNEAEGNHEIAKAAHAGNHELNVGCILCGQESRCMHPFKTLRHIPLAAWPG